MGILRAMAYSSSVLADLADHTYVDCGSGTKAWGCWGGKTNGKVLGQSPGSTLRADRIAQPDEKAGIKCYLTNGVCHQSANRILLPGWTTVRKARGYGVSEALFGTYGRLGYMPCRSPFHQYADVSGDLSECSEEAGRIPASEDRGIGSQFEPDRDESKYINEVLKIYREAETVTKRRVLSMVETTDFQINLFDRMVEFRLRGKVSTRLLTILDGIRRTIEKGRAGLEGDLARERMPVTEFVEDFNALTIRFQNEMAEVLKPNQYKKLFDLEPGETIILADPAIISRTTDLR